MMDQKKSQILRAMTHDGSARVLVINSTEMVNEMIKTHRSAPTATAALGRIITAASMIGTMLPEPDDTLTVTFAGDGPVGHLIAVANYYGTVKGYIENPLADPPRRTDGKLNVGAAVGRGTVNFVRDIHGGELQTGVSEIVSGEIAEDLAHYFANSEQIPTLLSLGVLVNPDGSCRSAGGVLIQLLPFPDDKTVDLIERNAAKLSSVSSLIDGGASNEDILSIALADVPYDLFDTVDVEYKCDCSAKRMLKKVRSLAKEEIVKMLDEEQAEGKTRELSAVCRFCGSSYTFTEKQLLC